mgnify:CR=1 FL=1
MNIENTTLHREAGVSAAEAIHLRRRSDGVLTPRQIEMFRASGIPLAYDPLQLGWIPVDCQDDLAPDTGTGSKLEFRQWKPGDAATLASMLSSEVLWQYLPEEFPGPIDAEAAAELIELGRADHHLVLAVTNNGVAIGQVRLLFNDPETAEVSYWLGEDYWGKGHASKMVKAFCDQSLRERMDLNRIFARVHKANAASQRVLEKASLRKVSEDGEWLIFERVRASH